MDKLNQYMITELVYARAKQHHIRTSSQSIEARKTAVIAIEIIEAELARLWADNRQHTITYENGKMVKAPRPDTPDEICIGDQKYVLIQSLNGWRKYIKVEEYLPDMRKIVLDTPYERILAELRIQFCIQEQLSWLDSLKPLETPFETESA